MTAEAARSHAALVAAWRQQRYAALRRDIGWLTLAGLDWLHPGINTVGSGAESDIVLPAGPADAGTITVGEELLAEGAVAGGATRPLTADDDGEPTMLELGSLRMCLIRRGERIGLRTWDIESPKLAAFAGIDHYPIDLAWRLRARVEPTPDRRIQVPDVLGDVVDDLSPARVSFRVAGRDLRLDALEGGERGELWLVFGDATNGAETYGGGRFLYTNPPDPDGTLWLDFNRAYNPPCVFSPYATCPLPPAQNRLPIAITAGERTFEWTATAG